MFDQIVKIEISGNMVAWYGAIVATLSFVTVLFNHLRDSSRIKVKIFQGFLAYTETLGDDIQIFVEAINTGRRPVTLSGAGLSLKNGSNIVIFKPEACNFPYELQEGKSIRVWVDKKYIFQESEKIKTKITHGWFRDATGKVYKTKFKFKKE